MDLFELQARLKLDDSSFNKGIENATNAGERLKNGLSAASVAMGNIAADMIRKGVSAINGVVRSAVDGYANYQQLIGGVETLFKTSAGKVAQYAKDSYKTTGLSANNYLETVTSFSASLMQGLGDDVSKAADLANLAVTDMADNANKMGTDMGSIQHAYMGFAKQNYTMLDNLKLGYGGTKTEMVRLINDSGVLNTKIKDLDGITFDQIIEAIHAIQEQMGVTGTTAEEANKTISGSAASMKSAWQDMLTAVTGEGTEEFTKYGYTLDDATAKFKESFETYMNNLIPAVQTTLNNAPELINALADAITSIPPKALSQATQSMVGVMTGAVEGATKIVNWILDSLETSITDLVNNPDQVTDLGEAIGTFIGGLINRAVTEIPTLLPKLFQLGLDFAGGVVDGFISGLTGMDQTLIGTFDSIDERMGDTIREATQSSAQAQGTLDYMQSLIDKYGEAAKDTDEWATALRNLESVLPGASEEIEKSNKPLAETVASLKEQVDLLREKAVEEAKAKALQEKREAYLQAEADLAVARDERKNAETQTEYAKRELLKYIRQYNPDSSLYDDNYYLSGEGGNLATVAFNSFVANSGLDQTSQAFIEAKSRIDGFSEALLTADTNYAALDSKISDLEQQVSTAKTRLEIAESAIDAATDAENNLASAAGNAANALNNIKGVKIPIGITQSVPDGAIPGKVPGTFYTPNATGKDFIPFNGYRAELHRGEAILTAAENRERLNGGMDYEALGSMVGDSIERAFSKVGIYMSGNRVADLTTRRMRGNINEETNARQRAMGG